MYYLFGLHSNDKYFNFSWFVWSTIWQSCSHHLKYTEVVLFINQWKMELRVVKAQTELGNLLVWAKFLEIHVPIWINVGQEHLNARIHQKKCPVSKLPSLFCKVLYTCTCAYGYLLSFVLQFLFPLTCWDQLKNRKWSTTHQFPWKMVENCVKMWHT